MVGVSSCEGVFVLAVEGWEGDWVAVCVYVCVRACVCACVFGMSK